MTDGEQRQPKTNFIEAGRNAFKMKIERIANPYNNNTLFAELWDKGYRLQERESGNGARRG